MAMAMARAEERTPRHVGDLCNAFLRRGADLAGYQFYVEQLNTGAQTRDPMRLGCRQARHGG
jgi:hypothetical protein